MTNQQVYESWIEGLISTKEALAQLCDNGDETAQTIVAMLRASQIPFYELVAA